MRAFGPQAFGKLALKARTGQDQVRARGVCLEEVRAYKCAKHAHAAGSPISHQLFRKHATAGVGIPTA
ncbi:MAG: hypothetical protein JO099_01455 [Acidobacteriia bacterium]|nr:hypothetical protein [Terriglobia bacterium]